MRRALPDESARWSLGGALASYRDLPAARDEQRPEGGVPPDSLSDTANQGCSEAPSK